MTTHKKNHFIPKFMLSYWVNSQTQHRGVHVYAVADRRTYVSTGDGPKPFSFAIANDLYVPTTNGRRAVGLEKWFSTLEGALSKLVRQAHARQQQVGLTHDTLIKALMAIIGLGFRSQYDIRLIQTEIEKNEQIGRLITGDDDVLPHKHVLENIIHLVNEKLGEFLPVDFVVHHAPRGCPYVISDRPCVAVPAVGFNYVVLTNKVVLGYRRSKDEHKLMHVDATEEFVHVINTEVSLNARSWLVADSARTLEKYSGVFNTNEWERRVGEDHLTFLPITRLTSGWSIER